MEVRFSINRNLILVWCNDGENYISWHLVLAFQLRTKIPPLGGLDVDEISGGEFVQGMIAAQDL